VRNSTAADDGNPMVQAFGRGGAQRSRRGARAYISCHDMLTIADYRALAEVRHRIRTFLAFSESEARAAGLEPQQHQLLLAVKGLPHGERATIRGVAARLVLKHHSVVELVNRLEALGLVERAHSDVDAREILVAITRRGERVLQKLSVAHRDEMRSAGPPLIEALEKLAPKRARARARARARSSSRSAA
jgi:DNA-binding MarR family transcriptional regulator